MSSEPFIRRNLSDGMDVVCASERRSSDRLSGMEGGQALHSSGSHSSLRKPLVRRSRSEHSLSHKGEDSWQHCGTHRGKGLRQWPWGRHMALFVCIAWPAVAFIMVSQVPWLKLSIQWTVPKAQGLQWMFANSDKSEACAAAARDLRPHTQCGLPKLYNPTFQPGKPAVLRGPRYKGHDPGMIKALQLLKPGSTYTDCFEFINENSDGPEVGIRLSAHQMYHTSDTNLDRLGFGFKAYTPGSLQHSNVCWCEGSNEPTTEELTSIPESTRVLFIAGAQKAGTTWLFNALDAHPNFVGASHAYKQRPGPWSKELHFFNRWPMPPPSDFLPCFPSNVTQQPGGLMPDQVLVDGTPDYLFNSVVAPRIKAVVPQARFVIILRDPVARAYSAWQMTMREMCPEGTVDCPVQQFAEAVQQELDTEEARSCLFNVPSNNKTWHSCFQCHYSHVDSNACTLLSDQDRQLLQQCNKHFGFGMLSVSNYAAQLAWWLNFFTPDRFLIVSSQELRDPDTSLRVLNRIIEHSGVQGAQQFDPQSVADVQGYDGSYSTESTTPEEAEAVHKLRLAFDKPMRDLDHLLTLYKLDEFFPGLGPEIQ